MSDSKGFFGKLLQSLGLGKPAPLSATPTPAISPEKQSAIDAALARFAAWQEANALPAVMLETTGPAEPSLDGSRIGGPAWLPEGEAWPLAADGRKMIYLAQLDFAALPALADFPTTGVVQFFIGTDDIYGCNFDKPEAGDFRVIYREDVAGPGSLQPNIVARTGMDGDYFPLQGNVLETGLGLAGTSAMHKPELSSWLIERDLPGLFDDPDISDAIYDRIDALLQEQPCEAHHMGGHPEFTQSDYRGVPGYQDVDRVLLNIWSQSGNEAGEWCILWGDVGQGQFTIRRNDLLDRRFDKALYQWDCS